MKPWTSLITPDQIDIVSPEGEVRSKVLGYYDGEGFVIDDMAVDVRVGDEIRRILPNGQEEVFAVADPKYFGSGGFGPHYQVKVRRQGNFDAHSGGNYSVSVSGANARVNINSTDFSTNTVQHLSVFSEVRSALEADGMAFETLMEVDTRLAEMQAAKDKETFARAYQNFVGAVADHITVVVPFLPALTEMMSKLA